MNNFFDNQRILDLIWKRKFHFIIIGAVAIVLSGIFSGPTFITPMYKATARVYPTNNIAVFSDESSTEQVLEIINSRDIAFKMFDVFDLAKVYKIDKNDPHFNTYMFDTYNKNVSASKTEFETVEIKVMDEDPLRASNMCDSIIYFFNKKVGELHAIKHLEVVKITDKYLTIKQHELDSVTQLLQELRNDLGIVSYSQLENITEGYMLALASNKGGTPDSKKIERQLNSFKEHGTKIYSLEKDFLRLDQTVDSLATLKEVGLQEAAKNITFSHVVEYPFVADKKSYPVRSLIVAFSTLSAIFIAILAFLILDYRKE